MLLKRMRLPIVLLVLALVVAACGGGGDNATDDGGSSGNDSASGADETSGSEEESGAEDEAGSDDSSNSGSDSGTESTGGGENGSINFEISGNWDADGEFVFIPEASVFTDGFWSLSFAPNRDGSGDKIITILLAPDSFFVTYGDPDITVAGGQDQCQFDISDQTVDGVSGTIDCSDLTGMPAESSMRDGVNFDATFDARS
jgi:hypothetical protein